MKSPPHFISTIIRKRVAYAGWGRETLDGWLPGARPGWAYLHWTENIRMGREFDAARQRSVRKHLGLTDPRLELDPDLAGQVMFRPCIPNYRIQKWRRDHDKPRRPGGFARPYGSR